MSNWSMLAAGTLVQVLLRVLARILVWAPALLQGLDLVCMRVAVLERAQFLVRTWSCWMQTTEGPASSCTTRQASDPGP